MSHKFTKQLSYKILEYNSAKSLCTVLAGMEEHAIRRVKTAFKDAESVECTSVRFTGNEDIEQIYVIFTISYERE